jgi:hypothetical protein
MGTSGSEEGDQEWHLVGFLSYAEIEISIFQRGCVSPNGRLATLRRRINTMELKRNRERCPISWQCTTNDARVKLHGLYPDLKNKLD